MRLFRLAVTLLGALPLALPCAAQPRAQLAANRFDYGDRLPGVLPPAAFTVTNTGDQPLVLRPQPCCGIKVNGAETAIPPGTSRQLSLIAPHPLGEGLFRKTVQVLTNDPATPELQLEVVAMGKSPIQLFPGDELTFALNAEFVPPQTVVLRCHDEPEFKITAIHSSAPYVHCKEVPPVLQDGEDPSRHRAVEISLAADAPTAPFEAVLVLDTTCKRRPQVKLHVYGLSATAVTAQPPRIDFDPIGKDQACGARVVVLTRTSGPFKILEATASDPRAKVVVNADSSGMFAELLVTFRPGSQRGPFQGTITVRTTDPERPRLVIPFAGEAS
jgi:hypothetical protein